MGNPNGWFKKGNEYGQGRPKGSGYVVRCRQWAEEGGWDLLFAMAEGKGMAYFDAHLRLEAIKVILAYGFGKPREAIDLSAGGGSLRDWLEERVRHIESSIPKALDNNGSGGSESVDIVVEAKSI